MRKVYAFLFVAISLILSANSTFAQPCSENFDGVTAPALPSGWTAITNTDCANSNPWVTVSTNSDSPPNSAFVNDPNCISDEWLDSRLIPIVSPTAQLTFRRSNSLETSFDGMVLEISIGGAPFVDILAAGGSFVSGGYNGTLSTAFGNPIGGRQAWTGNSGGFVTTTVNLPAAANGQTIILRWRRGADNSVAGVGAFIDNIAVAGSDCNLPCTPPDITSQPVNSTICAGNSTSFTATVTGVPSPIYQWQRNSGTGFVNVTNTSPFSGANTSTLTITGAGTAFNGNTFRLLATNFCAADTSNVVTLTVNPLPTISVAPNSQCAPVVLTASGTSTSYSWSPATGLSATTGATVTASPTTNTLYKVIGTIAATGCVDSTNVLVLGTPPTPVVTPNAATICQGFYATLSVPNTDLTFTSNSTISVPFTGTSGIAQPYASTISVNGLPLTGVTVKSVTINGIVHTFPGDIDILLQSPTGTNVILMSDAGGGTDATGQNYTFTDTASNTLATTLNATGFYRPTNYTTPDTWAAPGPGSVSQANPSLSMFTGNMNGNWGLYVVDDATGDIGEISGWSITFSAATAKWTPATGLYLDQALTIPYTAGSVASPIYASPAATTTYTVTGAFGNCNAPGSTTVTVTVNPAPTLTVGPNNQCSPVTLTATGNSNTYSWSPATGLNTTTGATVTANPLVNTTYTVTGTITNTGCTKTAQVTVNATPTAPTITPTTATVCAGGIVQLSSTSSGAFSSTGTITIPNSGNASPYPSTINVSGLPTTGSVTVGAVSINGLSHTFPSDVDIVLQSPTGTNVILMSDVGGSTDAVNVNLVFSDAAGAPLPPVLGSGTYRPTNSGTPDNFPAPGPGSLTQASPTLSSFSGNPNGTWNLFVVDDAGGDLGSISGWSITFNIAGVRWSPVTGLYTDPAATVPYVANTLANTVYAKPATTTTYSAYSVNGTCISAATTATVNVVQTLTITTQPANQTTCIGSNATFTIVTGGNFQVYQWQVSTDAGVTWNNLPGANSASLVLTGVTANMNGYRYRVLVNNTCSNVTSNSATLTVNPPDAVTIGPLPSRICISDSIVALSGLPVGGSWSGVGISGNNFIPPATAVGTYTLTYRYTNAIGCVSTGTVVAKVEECPERMIRLRDDAVILFPNPNNGQFNIRINSTLYNYLGMRVFTANGHLVKTQEFGGLAFGRIIPIDLSFLPGGTYIVKFYYDDGARSSDKSFKVIIGR